MNTPAATGSGGPPPAGWRLGLNLALAVAGLGLAPLAKKTALSAGAAPLPLALSVTAVAALLGMIYLALRGDRPRAALDGATWRRLALVGAMGSGAVVLLSVLAMTQTTATNRSLFQAMYPVATALCARWLLGEKLSRRAYGIIAVMCVGLFLMNTGDRGLRLGTPFLLLAATLPLIGLADVLAKRSLGATPPRLVASARLLFGALVLLAVLPWTDAAAWRSLPAQAGWVLLAGALMAGGVLFLYRAMDRAKASLVAAFVALAPVLTALAERLLLDARFSAMQLTGLALVCGGAVALARRPG